MTFVYLAAITITALWSVVQAVCPRAITLAVGTYTSQPWLPSANGAGVSLVTFKREMLNTTIVLSPYITGENPSYIAQSKNDLYMVNENAPIGALTHVSITPTKPFIKTTMRSTEDAGSTHVTVVKKHARGFTGYRMRRIIVVANYGGSVSTFIKTRTSFRLAHRFVVPTNLAAQMRNASLPDAQSSPHPHMSLEYGNGIIVPDLGSDIVWYFALNRVTGALIEISRVNMTPGDGPRHAALHRKSKTVYIVNELSLTVSVLRTNCNGNRGLHVCSRWSLIDDMQEDLTGVSAAAIRVSRDNRFLYVSVRYPDDIEGKIVAFRLRSNGDIGSKLGRYPSGGVHPRDLFIIDAVQVAGKCRSFLAVANRDTNNLALLQRNFASGRLFSGVAYNLTINTALSVVQFDTYS